MSNRPSSVEIQMVLGQVDERGHVEGDAHAGA